MVPKKLRDAVWNEYREGQCDDMNPSEEWHRAADAAIGFVASKEGANLLRMTELNALDHYGYSVAPDSQGILRATQRS
jgi:hypothetical protein